MTHMFQFTVIVLQVAPGTLCDTCECDESETCMFLNSKTTKGAVVCATCACKEVRSLPTYVYH